MEYYYDSNLVYPYLCLKGIEYTDLGEIVELLKENNLNPTKFYGDPKYPASNGVLYKYLFRLPFVKVNSNSAVKPDKETIDRLMEGTRGGIKTEDFVTNGIYKAERLEKGRLLLALNNLKTEVKFLRSEREAMKTDREFFKGQIKSLYELTTNLKKENNRVELFFEQFSSTIRDEIKSVGLNQGNVKEALLKLERDEKRLKDKEGNLNKFEIELKEREKNFEVYRAQEVEKLEEERIDWEDACKERVDDIRALHIGVIPEESYNPDPFYGLKILVVGKSNMTENDIVKVIKNGFSENFQKPLPKKHITVDKIEYVKLKHSAFIDKIKSTKYNYVVVGPHPHSTVGGNIKKSISTMVKDEGLDIMVKQSHKNSISKSALRNWVKEFVEDWAKKLENRK